MDLNHLIIKEGQIRIIPVISKLNIKQPNILDLLPLSTGADPGFLERGFICIMVWGGLLFISFVLNIP